MGLWLLLLLCVGGGRAEVGGEFLGGHGRRRHGLGLVAAV